MDPTGIPSIGDVLLLSQLAWRIGYAFAASRPSAPTQFYDIEIELKTLTKSLDLLAEALDDDNSILVHADDRAKAGVNKTLFNCQQSLEDLNAFMARYQELKSPESEVGTRGIQAVKTWKPLLLKNWSRSLPHLAQTVESAILRLDQVQSLASDTTNVTNQVDPEEEDNPTYSSNELADSTTDHPSSTDDLTSYDPSHTCASSPGDSSDGYLMESNTKFSVEVTQNYSPSATR
ncbi:MAG: hypothetical protein M1839_007678 [Geoglossum umbratile]|nr:MAG: hypothetical protein M1839_007678 [Geoglossum umbratile]